MGMARPLPMLSALHSGTFLSRSGSAPFRDCKRRDTGALDGTGRHARPRRPSARGQSSRRAPRPRVPMEPRLPIPARDAAAPPPLPAALARYRKQSCPSGRGCLGPPSRGGTQDTDRQMAWDAGGAWMEAGEAKAVKNSHLY